MKELFITIGKRIQNNTRDINNKPYPNIDKAYGPYISLDNALENLPVEVRNIGLKFGVYKDDTKTEIIDYWFKGGIEDENAVEYFGVIHEKLEEFRTYINTVIANLYGYITTVRLDINKINKILFDNKTDIGILSKIHIHYFDLGIDTNDSDVFIFDGTVDELEDYCNIDDNIINDKFLYKYDGSITFTGAGKFIAYNKLGNKLTYTFDEDEEHTIEDLTDIVYIVFIEKTEDVLKSFNYDFSEDFL